jgi:hypothetical protein
MYAGREHNYARLNIIYTYVRREHKYARNEHMLVEKYA